MDSQSLNEDPESPSDSGALHVLDLPQLHTKPPASSLLLILSQLAIKPASWDRTSNSNNSPPSINEDGIPSYLTRIISSPLNWVTSEQGRERIWEAASARLAERSGRTAMPSLTRTFQIPTLSTNPGAPETVDITIHEPSLTGDNLGHKTWAASYLLAKRLPKYISSNNAFQASCRWSTYVRPVQPTTVLDRYSDFNYEERVEAMKEWEARGSPAASSPWGDLRPRVLELGAGTGLVGLAASALFSMKFHLTDLDSIIPNLQHNVQENVSLAERSQSAVTVGVLDWSSEHPKLSKQDRYRFVLAADSLYAPQHAEWLANTMNAYLEHAGSARIFVELPIRTADSLEHVQFKSEMFSHSFRIEEEGEEVGYDDWEGSTQDDRVEVKCWWSVWYRQLNLDSPASDQKAPGGQLTAREKAI